MAVRWRPGLAAAFIRRVHNILMKQLDNLGYGAV